MIRKMCAAALLTGFFVKSAHAALVISTAPTSNVTCGGVVCAATSQNAVLNVRDLERWLAHRDTRVVSGSTAVDIEIDAPVYWTSAHRLTLDGYRSITFTQSVTSVGTGGMTITTNDGGTGGDFLFTGKGHVVFWDLASSLIIDSESYTLVADIETLASDLAANPSGRYALANDDHVASAYSSSPIQNEFTGVFEGLGNWIVNLIVNDPTSGTTSAETIGLFGVIAGGVVRDVKLKAKVAGVVGGFEYIGTLAGSNGGTISHCTAYGLVSGGVKAGGLVGWNTASVLGSHATVRVNGSGADSAGGLVGENGGAFQPPPPDPSLIADSDASGSVTVGSYALAGGLAGAVNFSTVLRSHASGVVRAGDHAIAGGLVAYSAGEIDRTWASGAVTVGDVSYAGGLIGLISQQRIERLLGVLTNSYATGPVAGGSNSYVGGLAGAMGGLNRRHVGSAYAVGAVSAGSGSSIGGLTGSDSVGGFAYQTYWDLDTSGISDPSKGAGNIPNDAGITGLTDAQLKSSLPAGFDPSIWGQSTGINNGLPYLLAIPPQ